MKKQQLNEDSAIDRRYFSTQINSPTRPQFKYLSQALIFVIQSQASSAFKILALSNYGIQIVDKIDQKIANQVLELDLSKNKLTSWRGLEQFQNLIKLNISHNIIDSLSEVGVLKFMDQLEMIQVSGNPLQEDEKYINNILKKNLRNIRYVNGKKVQESECNALSPSSQATTTANGGGYSSSLQNFGETSKELSTLLKSGKPLIMKFQAQHKSTSNLVNAKVGKNRSGRGSYDALGSGQARADNDNQKNCNYIEIDEPVDSFDQINFSNDMNIQEINLKKSKDLKNRLTCSLKGIDNHFQFLSGSSLERQGTKEVSKLEIKVKNYEENRCINKHFNNNLNKNNIHQANGQIIINRLDNNSSSNHNNQFRHQHASSSGSDHGSVQSATTVLTTSSRHSNQHQVPRSGLSRNIGGLITGQSTQGLTQSNTVGIELKKSSSQMNVKLKRESINFIKKEDPNSRNSKGGRGSFIHRQDSQDGLSNNGVSNVFSTMQDSKEKDINKNDRLLQNFVELLRKQHVDRNNALLKQEMFNNWKVLFRTKRILKVNGMKIYQLLNRIDLRMSKRVAKLKYQAIIKWKRNLTLQKLRLQVVPKLIVSVYRLAMKLSFNAIKQQAFGQQKLKQSKSGTALLSSKNQSKLHHFTFLNQEMNNMIKTNGFQTSRANQKTFYPDSQDTVLQELIKENVQQYLYQTNQQSKSKTRNSYMSAHGSANTVGLGSSMERKTTMGGQTNNTNTSNTLTSTAKKKKVSKHASSNNSRNNTNIMKHSQSSVTLFNGSNATGVYSLQSGSDKKLKIPSQHIKKITSQVQRDREQQQSLYKMFTSTCQKSGLMTERPTSASNKRASISNNTQQSYLSKGQQQQCEAKQKVLSNQPHLFKQDRKSLEGTNQCLPPKSDRNTASAKTLLVPTALSSNTINFQKKTNSNNSNINMVNASSNNQVKYNTYLSSYQNNTVREYVPNGGYSTTSREAYLDDDAKNITEALRLQKQYNHQRHVQ